MTLSGISTTFPIEMVRLLVLSLPPYPVGVLSYVLGKRFWSDTSCGIFDTSRVLPFWDSPTFYTRCRSLCTPVSLIIVVFQASRTKVSRQKEAGNAGNHVKMTIVDQVEVDTRSLVGARTRDKFVADSSAHTMILMSRTSLNASMLLRLVGWSKGTQAKRLIATARFFILYSLSFSDSYSDFSVLFGALKSVQSYFWTSRIGSNCSILLWYIG